MPSHEKALFTGKENFQDYPKMKIPNSGAYAYMRFKPQGKIIEMTKNPESFLIKLRFLAPVFRPQKINTNLGHHQNTK